MSITRSVRAPFVAGCKIKSLSILVIGISLLHIEFLSFNLPFNSLLPAHVRVCVVEAILVHDQLYLT